MRDKDFVFSFLKILNKNSSVTLGILLACVEIFFPKNAVNFISYVPFNATIKRKKTNDSVLSYVIYNSFLKILNKNSSVTLGILLACVEIFFPKNAVNFISYVPFNATIKRKKTNDSVLSYVIYNVFVEMLLFGCVMHLRNNFNLQ